MTCISGTVVLEYISSQPKGVQLARSIRGEVILFTVKYGIYNYSSSIDTFVRIAR